MCPCVCVFNLAAPSLLAFLPLQTLTTASPIHARTEGPALMRSTPLSAFVCPAMEELRVRKVKMLTESSVSSFSLRHSLK